MTQRVFRPELAPSDLPLFDVHVNLGVTDEAREIYGRMPADAYPPLMEASGTRRACVFPPMLGDYAGANRALADWAHRRGPHMLPFARLGGRGGPRPIRAPWQARRAMRARLRPDTTGTGEGLSDDDDLSRYAGVKLIPHMSGMPARSTLKRIDAAGLPILIHGGAHSPPRWIQRSLLPHVSGPVIIAHLGAFPAEAHLVEQAVQLAQADPRVYLDTSATWLASFLTYAARRVPGKLLFGSDAPMVHPAVARDHLISAVHDDAALRAIAHGNAQRLFARWLTRRGDAEEARA